MTRHSDAPSKARRKLWASAAPVHTPKTTWQGNEVEKRDFMFHLAEQVAEPNVDWYFVIDGDEVVTDHGDLHAELAACELDAGLVTLWGYMTGVKVPGVWPPRAGQWLAECPLRKLFRAIPGLGVQGRHYHYVVPDGRYLWGDLHSDDMVPAAEFAVRVHHRNPLRARNRDEHRRGYYERRDHAGVERDRSDPCSYVAGVEAERAEHVAAGSLDRVRECDDEIARARTS